MHLEKKVHLVDGWLAQVKPLFDETAVAAGSGIQCFTKVVCPPRMGLIPGRNTSPSASNANDEACIVT